MKNALIPRYNNIIFRLTGCLFAAVFITLYNTDTGLFVAMKFASFYRWVALSFLVAFFLIQLTHFTTTILDKHFDWSRKPFRRSGLQTAFGILLPVLAAYYIMLLYFNHFDGRDIHASGYMLIYFPHIVYFIILFNVYYVIHYLVMRIWTKGMGTGNVTTENILQPVQAGVVINTASYPATANIRGLHTGTVEQEAASPGQQSAPQQPEGEEKLLLQNIGNICFFYRYNNKNRIVFMDGYSTMTGLSLDRIEELVTSFFNGERLLPFFRINRQVLIGSNAFDMKDIHLSTRQNQIEVYTRYLSPSTGIVPDLFKIGRFNLEKFKRWVAGQQSISVTTDDRLSGTPA